MGYAMGMCGQRRPRSACADALPDHAARDIRYYRLYQRRADARMKHCACTADFAHAQRHYRSARCHTRVFSETPFNLCCISVQFATRLTFTTLWAYSVDVKLVIFFLFFPPKQDLTFHANSLHVDYLHEMSNPVYWEK